LKKAIKSFSSHHILSSKPLVRNFGHEFSQSVLSEYSHHQIQM
jgi:hypothetical protein